MDDILYRRVANSTSHRLVREQNANHVIKHPELFADLLAMALCVNDKYHHKACWTLEIVIDQKIEWLHPYLDLFCETLPKYEHDGAIRSISKICWLAAAHGQKNPSKNFLKTVHCTALTEVCFNWLIGDDKVAAKAYSIRALFELGKTVGWIYTQLVPVLQQGFPNHSPAYKAVAREILSKIDR